MVQPENGEGENMSRYDYLERMKEPSTWAGLAILASLFGVQIAPEQMNTIVQAGTGFAAAVAIFMPERKAK